MPEAQGEEGAKGELVRKGRYGVVFVPEVEEAKDSKKYYQKNKFKECIQSKMTEYTLGYLQPQLPFGLKFVSQEQSFALGGKNSSMGKLIFLKVSQGSSVSQQHSLVGTQKS